MKIARFVLCVALCFAPYFSSVARADDTAQPYRAVRLETRVSQAPPQQIWLARVALSDADVEVRVAPGGADPDGDGPFQTTLQTLSQIAAREHFEVAINGDFFVARATADAEGARSGYVEGKWASAVGPAATDGFLWAPADKARPALWLDAAKIAHIAVLREVPSEARQVIAGSDVLLRQGQIVLDNTSKFATARHPRTAVGLSDGGKTLVLVVADGRDAARAAGLSLDELTILMRDLGCSDALNLDGGGSSEMVLRAPESGQLRVLNRPSDGRERAVANVLGVSIRGARRAPGTMSSIVNSLAQKSAP